MNNKTQAKEIVTSGLEIARRKVAELEFLLNEIEEESDTE